MIHGKMYWYRQGALLPVNALTPCRNFRSASNEPTIVVESHIDAGWLGVQPCDILAGII